MAGPNDVTDGAQSPSNTDGQGDQGQTQQQTAEGQAADAGAGEGQDQPFVDTDDPDYQEVLAAQKAVEDEDAGVQTGQQDGGQQGTPEGGQQAAQPDVGQQQPQGDGQQQPASTGRPMPDTVPIERFNEVNNNWRQTQHELAKAQGVNEGLQLALSQRGNAQQGQPGQGGDGTGQQQLSPTDELAGIKAKKIELARKFDEGELSMVQHTEQLQALDDRADELRGTIRAEETRRQQPQQGAQPDGDMYLESLTAQLESQHPYTQKVDTPERWKFLRNEAVSQLNAQGHNIPTEGNWSNAQRYHVRKAIAELTDTYGPVWYGQIEGQQQQQQPNNAGNANQNGNGGGNSKIAQQRQAKLAMAQNQPPNINQLPGAGTPTDGQVSAAQIENMSDDQIADMLDKMPDAAKQALESRL